MTAKVLNVGVVGLHPNEGWASTAHLPALLRLKQFRVLAVSHHDEDVARASAVKFGVPHHFDSNDALMRLPEIDLVAVSVKVPRHRELVSKAIAAGKPVLSDWPLGISTAEAMGLRDLADAEGVRSSICLQTRSSPSFSYAKALVRDGYVGDVLSASVIGSGILWGEEMGERYAYTLDPVNGAGMLNVPFAHSIDALLHVLNGRFGTVMGLLGNARTSVRMTESGLVRPMGVADQVQVIGTLTNGVAVSAHFRGGMSRATNFHVEINGTEGDLIISSPVGYVGAGGTRLMGARKNESLGELTIPQEHNCFAELGPVVQNVAIHYARLARDFIDGTHSSPTFSDALALHRLVDEVEHSAKHWRAVGGAVEPVT